MSGGGCYSGGGALRRINIKSIMKDDTESSSTTSSTQSSAPLHHHINNNNHNYYQQQQDASHHGEASAIPSSSSITGSPSPTHYHHQIIPQIRRKTKLSRSSSGTADRTSPAGIINSSNSTSTAITSRTPSLYNSRAPTFNKPLIAHPRLLDDPSDDERSIDGTEGGRGGTDIEPGTPGPGTFIMYRGSLQEHHHHQHQHYHHYYRENTEGSGVVRRRKYSFPISLLSSTAGSITGSQSRSSLGGGLLHHQERHQQRRRFSSVLTHAVTRKLSTTMGWNKPSPSALNDLVNQGKALCGQFIRWRLKRCGMLPRKCGLQRTGGIVVLQVMPQMVALVSELERLHPRLYSGVARQACPSPGGLLSSERLVVLTLTRVADHVMAEGVSWPKIASLYGVAAGLALDCVLQGHPQFLQAVTDAMAQALHQAQIAPWIFLQGGWMGLQVYCRPPSGCGMGVNAVLGMVILLIASLLLLGLGFRLFGKFGHNSHSVTS